MQPNVPTPGLMHTLLYNVHEEPTTGTSAHPYLTKNLRYLTAAYSSIYIHTANIFVLSHHSDCELPFTSLERET